MKPKIASATILMALVLEGCSPGTSNQFRLRPVDEALDSGQVVTEEVVSKEFLPVDVLWVIDNSASMKPSQTKLRNGLRRFADRFLTPETDIQLGVITSDAFVANALFEKYLTTPVTAACRGKKAPAGKLFTPRECNRTWTPELATLTESRLMKTKGQSLDDLVARFEKEVSVGTSGMPEERGFGSVLQFLEDNERGESPQKLFRKGSQRVIIFVTDEDDQTLDFGNEGPEPRKLLFNGSYYTGKDLEKAKSINPAHITTQCPPVVIDGVTLAPKSVCTRPELLMPVESFKKELEKFFRKLDGSADPRLTVVSIVAQELDTIRALRGASGEVTHDRGDRYLELTQMVGGESFAMDIGATEYEKILEKIGLAIEHRSTRAKFKARTRYKLLRAPAPGERLVVRIHQKNGTVLTLTSTQYRVDGNSIELTDESLQDLLKAGDRVQVFYQPATVRPAGSSIVTIYD